MLKVMERENTEVAAKVKGFNVGDLELQFVMIKSVVKITDGNGFTQNV